MKLIILISTISLERNKFYPHFSFIEEYGNMTKTIAYTLDNPTIYDKKELAINRAKIIALSEAGKIYGEGIEFRIQISE